MQLETERSILREFVQSDWSGLAAYRADSEFARFFGPAAGSDQRAKDLVAAFVSWQSASPRRFFQFAVTLKETGTLIGCAGLRRRLLIGRLIDPDPPVLPDEGDIGYELGRDWRGQGFATEAGMALLKFGFSELNLRRVWAWCAADNAASVAVLERLAMKREALFHAAEHLEQGWVDVAVYTALGDEWRTAARA